MLRIVDRVHVLVLLQTEETRVGGFATHNVAVLHAFVDLLQFDRNRHCTDCLQSFFGNGGVVTTEGKPLEIFNFVDLFVGRDHAEST